MFRYCQNPINLKAIIFVAQIAYFLIFVTLYALLLWYKCLLNNKDIKWNIGPLLSCISAHETFIERDIVLLLNSQLNIY